MQGFLQQEAEALKAVRVQKTHCAVCALHNACVMLILQSVFLATHSLPGFSLLLHTRHVIWVLHRG